MIRNSFFSNNARDSSAESSSSENNKEEDSCVSICIGKTKLVPEKGLTTSKNNKNSDALLSLRKQVSHLEALSAQFRMMDEDMKSRSKTITQRSVGEGGVNSILVEDFSSLADEVLASANADNSRNNNHQNIQMRHPLNTAIGSHRRHHSFNKSALVW